MKGLIRKWWIVPVALLLAAVIAVVAFWDQLAIYIAPKTVLREALKSTVSQMEQRFGDSPTLMVLDTLDPEGKQTVQLALDTSNSLLGDIQYNMTLQMEPHRVLAEGTASAAERQLDLSVYLDQNFMAVSSDSLVSGSYYGITYDTFSGDIRSIPLLTLFVSDSVLTEWEASVQGIRENIGNTWKIPQIPSLSQEEMETLLLAILAMPADVDKTSILAEEETLLCHRITYSLSGEQVAEGMSELLDRNVDSNISVTASFYLWEKKLIMAEVTLQTGESTGKYQLELGKDPQMAPLKISGWTQAHEEEKKCFQVTAQQGSGEYREAWSLRAGEESVNFSYDWDAAAGEMELTVEQLQPVSLKLTQKEQSLHLQTASFSALMAALSGKEGTGEIKIDPCSMTISKGSAVVTPQYKNLNQWSLEDFLILLEGLGGLLGLKLV